jgi:hypothetical protein
MTKFVDMINNVIIVKNKFKLNAFKQFKMNKHLLINNLFCYVINVNFIVKCVKMNILYNKLVLKMNYIMDIHEIYIKM